MRTNTNPFDALGDLIDRCTEASSNLREVRKGETVEGDLYRLVQSIADDLDAYASDAGDELRDAIANEKDIAADYAEERDQAVDRTSNLAQDILDFEHGLLDYHELLQAARENI
jgi:ABC-type transporter Mla subunit MlaD